MGPYRRVGARIIIWLIRPNTAFLSAQSLNHLCLAYTGLNPLIQVSFLFDNDREGTRSRVSQPKFLISVYSVKVNFKKLMPCKYFTMFLFMFVLQL